MKGDVIFYAFAFFAVALIFHVIIWRVRPPKPAWLPLIAIMLAAPLVLIGMTLVAVASAWPGPFRLLTLSEWLAAYVLHCAMAGGYFFLYPTAEVGSPTLRMTLWLKASMPRGMSATEIEQVLDRQDDLAPRLTDLIKMGLVTETEGRLTLTLSGQAFLRPFMLLRQTLGLPPGAG